MMTAGFVAEAAETPHAKLQAVPFDHVTIDDAFWKPRIETNRTVTLPHNLKWCEDTGRISNFAKAGKLMPGQFEGTYFNDSDVYKVLEGAAYTLAQHPDKELEERIDAIIDKIAAAQQPDGYLMTYYTLTGLDKRWTDLPKMHEMYCAGHLFEAAVAYRRATGKDKLLKVACKLADHIDSIFGPGKRIGYCGHQEIELALVKLWRETGEERYLRLAEFFVAVRGQKRDQGEYWCQAHLPICEQSEIVGHAVRAMYYYAGVADIAAVSESRCYIDAMERLWRNVAGRKMYITGGIGATSHHEAFGADYDLPNDTAYAETCAAIGMALWNHRLLLLHGEGRFADVLERVIYNGALSGVSLDGEKFFYVNPLASRGKAHRQPWFGCACCPSNVVRFLPSIGGYIYATDESGAWVNLYVAGTGKLSVAGKNVTLKQETKYPWEGSVRITVQPAEPAQFTLHLRIPEWAQGFTVKVNGQAVETKPAAGYVALARSWKGGDVVELDLPMNIRRVVSHPNVTANVGRTALQRGPVIYCLEGVDHDGRVRNIALPRHARLDVRFDEKLLGGVAVIEGKATALAPADVPADLYPRVPRTTNVDLKAVPYYAWDNRDGGEMVVWIPEAPCLAEPVLKPSKMANATLSASVTEKSDLAAMKDNLWPRSSNDGSMPAFSWQGRKGTSEWVTCVSNKPQMLSSVEVYWLDNGEKIRVPKSWQVMWKKQDKWEPVEPLGLYTTAKDGWNRVDFKPVPTLELRLEVQLQENAGAGIIEWRVR
ncbi:MAG TPA: beta-L-arabinofuranosidase domain-containing protein [Phycisphaerae bacterium]|nr:beta-L-arabinofuranosidase domain-containing protein [Phycisphaerae bacterium]